MPDSKSEAISAAAQVYKFSRAQKMAYVMKKTEPNFEGQCCRQVRLWSWVQLENPEVSWLALVSRFYSGIDYS